MVLKQFTVLKRLAALKIREITITFAQKLRLDNKLRPQISLNREIMIFPRLSFFGEYEYQADFGWVDDLPEGKDYKKEETITVGADYFLSKNFSLTGSYDNRFGAGGGLSVRF